MTRKKSTKRLAMMMTAAMALAPAHMAFAEETGGVEELEYVKLKGISVGDGNEMSDFFLEKLNELLMRDLNCELELENLSWSDWSDKYSLCFASGESFDFIFTANWAFYTDQSMKGGFYELTEEELKEYMPLTCEAVGDNWDQTKVNGKMYMIPQTAPSYAKGDCFGVRGDLMEEAGLEKITTADEMKQYLDYAVENHPELSIFGVSGNDYIPAVEITQLLTEDETIKKYSNTQEYYEGASNNIVDTTDLSELKWLDEETVDEYYLNLFKEAKELRERGYWDADCLSSTANAYDQYNAGNGAAVCRNLGSVYGYNCTIDKMSEDFNAHIVRLTDAPFRMTPCTQNGVGIHATSKDPQRTMMVLDKLGYDSEYHDLMRYGIEGEHYTLDEDGNVVKDPENQWMGQPIAMGIYTKAMRDDAVSKVTDNMNEYKELREWSNENNFVPVLATFNFDNSSVLNEVSSINALKQQYIPILYTGMAEDVEATYKEWKEAIKAAGIDAVKEEYLKQAQEYVDSLQ